MSNDADKVATIGGVKVVGRPLFNPPFPQPAVQKQPVEMQVIGVVIAPQSEGSDKPRKQEVQYV
jgi:hypothetical protein